MTSMASLSGKDLVRDLDYTPSLLTGSASMARAVLVAALDSPGSGFRVQGSGFMAVAEWKVLALP